MARRIFFSFHYEADNWRAQQVRNIGAIEGNAPASPNEWETVKRGGDAAIQRWIDKQLLGRTCTIVLIGAATAGRPWIKYEIEKSWTERKGLLGVYIHGLRDSSGRQCAQGANPFAPFRVGNTNLSSIVEAHLPPYSRSEDVYAHIANNLESWIERAILIRSRY